MPLIEKMKKQTSYGKDKETSLIMFPLKVLVAIQLHFRSWSSGKRIRPEIEIALSSAWCGRS